MKDIWNTLADRTKAWSALGRQGLADAVWADYVSFRFSRTGDPQALEYLYPYLNHARKPMRLRAIDVAARVFEGRGPKTLENLRYFTKNPDPFLQDRAVKIIGGAVTGSPDQVILDVLGPYLNHPNQFIRKQALVSLGDAAVGSASSNILTEILRVAKTPGPRDDEVDMAVAKVYAGQPTDAVYRLVVHPEFAHRIDTNNEYAVSVLICESSEEWYERAYEDVFKSRLHVPDMDPTWRQRLIEREGIHGLALSSTGRGMIGLQRMLHLRERRCAIHAMMYAAPRCFVGADVESNREALIKLAIDGDVPIQRLAAVCLGRLAMGIEDTKPIRFLKDLCNEKNKAVQAAALKGLGLAAKSTCDREVHRLCLDRAMHPETAVASIGAIGLTFLGSGQSDIFDNLSEIEQRYRSLPVRGRRHCKAMAACYPSIGMLYLGTGSEAPLELLLDALSRPGAIRAGEYHWAAAKAIVMVEFPESVLGYDYIGMVMGHEYFGTLKGQIPVALRFRDF